MSKTGKEYLRRNLVAASNALGVHNTEQKANYENKLKKVTKLQHKRALALTARKLVGLVFALLKKGQVYKATTSRKLTRYIQFSKSKLANFKFFKK